MAITKYLSRKIGADRLGQVDFDTGKMSFGELVFTVIGATNMQDAIVFALSRIGAPEDVDPGGIPNIFMGAPCLGINQMSVDEAGNFDIYMNYRIPDATNGAGGSEDVLTFNTSGGTQHVNFSLATMGYGSGAVNRSNAIGKNAAGEITGVDIDVAEFAFTIDRALTAAQVDALIPFMRDVTDNVNLYPMFGADPGEIRFRGASGLRAGSGSRVAFNFLFSENKTQITIAGVSGVNKNGHEYLEVEYTPRKDTPSVLAVYVHQVYYLADLRGLGFT